MTSHKGALDRCAKVSLKAVKEFWDAQPCNSRHSKQPAGSREYFEQVASRRYFVEPHIPLFADFAAWSGKRVLDLGCGIGTDAVQFAKAGATVCAIDISEKSLELARAHARCFGVADNISFVRGDMEELDTFLPASEQFDLVYSFGAIHHTPNPHRAIEKIRQVLVGCGELRIMLYNRASFRTMQILMQNENFSMQDVDAQIARCSEAQRDCPVTFTYTPTAVRAMLSDFEVLSIEKAHIFHWDIPAYIRGEYCAAREWEGVGIDEIRELAQEIGWHLLVKARLR